MTFPRNKEGKLDIEAYINLLKVNPEAAQKMEDELENEEPEVINYFYDNLERIKAEIEQRNNARNQQVKSLDARQAELEKQRQQYTVAFQKDMEKTLHSTTTNSQQSAIVQSNFNNKPKNRGCTIL